MIRILAAVILFLPLFAFADKPVYTIYTGFQKGDYNKIAEDMQKACTEFQINIEPTQGSLSNINALISSPVTQAGNRLGLVQRDALESILGTEPRAQNFYKVITPLYPAEIAIIVNKKAGITNVKDLNGRRVAIGLSGSGAWFTANKIRAALDIKWLPLERTPEESILLVLTGEIDALIVVGGSPIRLFQELGKTMSERVVMIPVNNPELEKMYTAARVPANTYLWQDYPVETKATQSILIAAADVSDNAIKEFHSCLARNLSAIKKFGHPKWKRVSLTRLRQQ